MFLPLQSNIAVQYRGVEQLVARRAHNPEAGGSSPSPATKQDNSSGLSFFCFDERTQVLQQFCGFLTDFAYLCMIVALWPSGLTEDVVTTYIIKNKLIII